MKYDKIFKSDSIARFSILMVEKKVTKKIKKKDSSY